MSRLDGVRERRHQPFYDTLTRTVGTSNVSNLTQLFGNGNVGNRALTNLQVAGVLAADQTLIIKVLRSVLWFYGLSDSEFGVFGTSGLPNFAAVAIGTSRRALDLYPILAYGCYFQLTVGDKPMFTAPIWYAPAGGGPVGFTSENARSIVTNGVGSHESILRLGKDIHVPARQNFNVAIEFFPFVVGTPGLGAAGGAIPGALDPLNELNAFDGAKLFQFVVDGIQTRDVQ